MDNKKIINFVEKKLFEHFQDYKEILILSEFGSSTYGTNNKNSDIDLTVIYEDNDKEEFQFLSDKIDIQFISRPLFEDLLIKCDIKSLEAFFYDKKIINNYSNNNLSVNLSNLRKSISSIVSNSWVKAKKKVLLENEDNYTGYKSLFHSFRILLFGIQLAKYNKIIDFTEGNKYYFEILNKVKNGENIIEIMAFYKHEHNNLQTEFRKLAPKEENLELTY